MVLKTSTAGLRIAVLALLGCSAGVRAADIEIKTPPPIDPANFDPNVKPGDDFFHYVNGTWLKTNPIPPEFTNWGASNELDERNKAILHIILDDCAAAAAKGGDAAPAGSVQQKVGDFYASGMDEAAIDAQGTQPHAPELERIAALKDRAELPAELAHLHGIRVRAFFDMDVDADEKDSLANIVQLGQGGLGLPERDYYLKDDEKSKTLRTKYQEHVARIFGLLGDKPEAAAAEARTVLNFETELAKVSKTKVMLRDPESNYHKMTLAEFAKSAPGFDWPGYFAATGAAAFENMDVGQPEFFTRAAELAATQPLDDWKTYLRWQLVHAAAPDLSKEFVNENFQFYGQTLTGAKELRPRWKRILIKTDLELGEALGQLYVDKAFPPAAKARALTLINDLKSALRERLAAIEWMGPQTRAAAFAKLDAFGVKIGYPEKWRDYSALEIKRQPHILNVLAGNNFEFKRVLARIGKPVDTSEWFMTPPTVNAYYNPVRNEIVFPAGIFQPPFFNANADDAVNYGGMGAIIGHEMTHGFDDRGRQYDAQGNLKNWWTPEDLKRFQERGNLIVAQFFAYEPLPGVHVNGKLTEGENIADLGGIKIAYAALEKALDREGPEARDKKIDGFNPEQRFFLSWGQIWRRNIREEMERMLLNIDPHSPNQFRTNGPLSNLPEFQKVFAIPDGSAMVRPAKERVDIW